MIPDDIDIRARDFDLVGADFGVPTRAISLFDEADNGASRFLYWPFERRPIYVTQYFRGTHYGLDIGIPNGTKYYNPLPVRAQVVIAGWDNSGYGYMVGLKSDELGMYVIIAHMQKINPDLRVGNWVDPFEFLGWSDSTGNSTGPHLHLEVRTRRNGYYPYPSSCIDPYVLMRWYSGQVSPPPSPNPPPKPEPVPPPVPRPGWYRVRATKELSLYRKQNLTSVVSWPKITSGAIIQVQDRKKTTNLEWVILENGLFALKRNKRKILLVPV